jgi:thiosulfate/3-mercaptopyruvate sulfurtransferase
MTSNRTRILGSIAVAAILHAHPATAQCGPPDETVPAVRESLLVTTQWLAAHLSDTNVVVVHVDHMSNGYAQAHIPGARHVDAMAITVGDFDMPPMATLDSLVEALGISNTSRVVLYGDPWVTGFVFAALDLLGHGDRTAMLDGGLEQWRAEGRPTTTQAPAASRGTYTPRPRPGVIADAAWVRAHLADDRVAVLDVRTADEYAGGPGRDRLHGGHLPGARLLPWSEAFENPSDALQSRGSRLKSPYALRTMLRLAGVHGGVTPVLYCTVGMRASQMYFILRYLGYDPKFYDGSITDWTHHSDYPIVTGNARGNP